MYPRAHSLCIFFVELCTACSLKTGLTTFRWLSDLCRIAQSFLIGQSKFSVNQRTSFQSLTLSAQPECIWLVCLSCWEHLDLRMHWEKDAHLAYWRHWHIHKYQVNTHPVHLDKLWHVHQKWTLTQSNLPPNVEASLQNGKSLKRSLSHTKTESTSQDGAPPDYLLPGSSERPLMALLPHSSQPEVHK